MITAKLYFRKLYRLLINYFNYLLSYFHFHSLAEDQHNSVFYCF